LYFVICCKPVANARKTQQARNEFVLPKGAKASASRQPKFAAIDDERNPPKYDGAKLDALLASAKASRNNDVMAWTGITLFGKHSCECAMLNTWCEPVMKLRPQCSAAQW